MLVLFAVLFGVSPLFSAASPLQIGDPKQAKAELKQLLTNVKSSDDTTVVQALMGLADFGPQAEPAIADLIASVQSKNEDRRLNAAIVLGKIGKAAESCRMQRMTVLRVLAVFDSQGVWD